MKKFLILCLCLAFACLVGCSSTSDNTESKPKVTSSPSSADKGDKYLYASGKINNKTSFEIKNNDGKVLLDEKSVEKIDVYSEKDENLLLTVKFSEEGTKKFADVTEANIGNRLSFYIDGHFFTSSVLTAKISGGELCLASNYNSESVMQIFDTLTK